MTTTSYQKDTYAPEPSEKWLKNDEGCNRFYVYVLKLENGDWYAGQTRDLKARILEHKEGLVKSTAGKQPKLKYFEALPAREAALIREYKLKQLIAYNPRELIKLIVEFQTLIAQVY